jgi:hypothetical protein
MMMMAVVVVVDHVVVVVIIVSIIRISIISIIIISIVYSDYSSSTTLFLFRFLADLHEDLGRRPVLLVRLLERLGRLVVFKVPRSLVIAPGIDHFAIAAVAVQDGSAYGIG